MPLPKAEAGLVFRYDFLWNREARQGRSVGKERPACLAVATDPESDPQVVVVLPITHSKPTGGTIGVEIPLPVRRMLGMDSERCWVIVTEFNIDEWPPAGMAPLPGTKTVFAYGILPDGVFDRIKTEFLKHFDGKRGVRR
jgi:hypothetical protein